MPTAKERELLKSTDTIIVGRKFVINFDRGFVFIAPYKYEKNHMSKEFKERCRVLKIEPKLRPYIFKHQELLTLFSTI